MVGGATYTKDIAIGGLQRIIFADELLEGESELKHKDVQNEQESIVGGEMHAINGDVEIEGAEGMILEDMHLVEAVSRNENGHREVLESFAVGEKDAHTEVQIGLVEGMLFEDEQLVMEAEFRTEEGQSKLQERLICEVSQTCTEDAQIGGAQRKDELHAVKDELKNEEFKNEVSPSLLCHSIMWP